MSHLPTVEDLAALWELSDELLSITGTSGRFIEVNDAWPRALGWSRQELTSRPFIDFVHPDDRERTLKELSRLTTPGSKVEGFENRYRHHDGSYRWLSWTARTDNSGERIYSVTHDVTDRVTKDAALRSSEARFRLAMQSAPIGMGLVGLDRRFTVANDALLELFGYTLEELRSLTVAELTHPDDRAISASDFKLLSSGQADRVMHEKRYLTKEGDILWALLSASVITDADGQPTMYIAQIVDLSDRKRAERDREILLTQLEEQNSQLEQFAGAASHDLISPLTTMLGFLDLAAAGDLPDDERLQLIEKAQGIGHRSVGLVKSLLRFSRLGSAELAVAPTDLVPIIESTLELLGADEDADVEIEGPIPRVQADAGSLQVLLQNVIGNALKFRRDDEPACVRISARRHGDDIELIVDDAGPGIPDRDRDRIFAPFARTETGKRFGGAGLGLATAQRVATRHGGSIHADTSPLGGARLIVRLPAAFADAARRDDR